MTQIPTVGRTVHYQSYGTPGGEYLPEARAAIITEVTGRTPSDHWLDAESNRDWDAIADDAADAMRVGLCVLNPTGQFFNRDVPYAEEPTPGHWNWPPIAHTPPSGPASSDGICPARYPLDQSVRCICSLGHGGEVGHIGRVNGVSVGWH